MSLTLDDEKNMLRAVVRSIDRKAEFTVSAREGDQPGVVVTVVLRKHKATVTVPADQLEGALQDAMRRSQLRTTIKRAIDRASFEPAAIASTKMMRGKVVEGGFFRSQQGGGRGGRR
jgi:hypothetical protein